MAIMSLDLYNSIIKDFNEILSFNRSHENKIKEKYKHVPKSTIGSIISWLIQRTMKNNYRKTSSTSSKYHKLYKENINNPHAIIILSEQFGISPALFARSLLYDMYSNEDVKLYLKDNSHILDKDLAYQVYLATMLDNQYGGYADTIKQSIGSEYEIRIERELRLLDIPFSDEHVLRAKGYDKTPDYKLDTPIAVDGFIVNWVESKALFGDEENHSGYLKDQLTSYWNRFGTGLVIYWFGYLETLNVTPEVNNMFILRTSFPAKESITQYKLDI